MYTSYWNSAYLPATLSATTSTTSTEAAIEISASYCFIQCVVLRNNALPLRVSSASSRRYSPLSLKYWTYDIRSNVHITRCMRTKLSKGFAGQMDRRRSPACVMPDILWSSVPTKDEKVRCDTKRWEHSTHCPRNPSKGFIVQLRVVYNHHRWLYVWHSYDLRTAAACSYGPSNIHDCYTLHSFYRRKIGGIGRKRNVSPQTLAQPLFLYGRPYLPRGYYSTLTRRSLYSNDATTSSITYSETPAVFGYTHVASVFEMSRK